MDLAAAMDLASDPRKLGVALIILFVSLFAVSFPTISKQIPCIRIPGVVFFVGKHFGTGVILATAFIHLLDDAFRSLQSTKVEQTYHHLGKWTGSIILASLLSIFLIEYISTTYVEHLHDKPSAPPSPVTSLPPSRSLSRAPSKVPSEATPLLLQPHGPDHPTPDHPPHHSHHPHQHHHPTAIVAGLPIDIINNSPRICRLAIAHDHVHEHQPHSHPNSHHLSTAEHLRVHEQEHRPKIGRRRQIVGILVLQLGIMIHSLVIGMTLALTSGSDFTSLTTAIIFHQLFEGFSLGIRIAAIPSNTADKDIEIHDIDDIEEEDAMDARLAVAVEEALRVNTTAAADGDVERGLSKSQSKSKSRKGKIQKWYNPFTWTCLGEINWFKTTLSFLFGVTTPFGMALGLTLWPTNAPGRGGAKMMLVQGVMSAISAGMLIYAGTVEMLAGDFVFGDVEGGHHHHHHEHDEGDSYHGHGHGHSQNHARTHDPGHSHHREQQRQRKDGHYHDHEHEHNHNHEHETQSRQGHENRDSQTPSCSSSVNPCGHPNTNANAKPNHRVVMQDNEDGISATPKVMRKLKAAGVVDLDEDGGEEGDDGDEGGDGEKGKKKSSFGKRMLAVFSLLCGVATMVLVGLGE